MAEKMAKKKSKLKLGLAGLTLLAALVPASVTINKCREHYGLERQICLSREIAYDIGVTARRLEDACSMLTYDEKEKKYPNPKDAREQIALAQWELSGFGLNYDVDELSFVYDSLPEQNNVEKYEERAVDYSSFKIQRARINEISKGARVIEKRFRDVELLKERKTQAEYDIAVGYAISSVFASLAISLLYHGIKKERSP